MEENFILAKKYVEHRFGKDHELYPMLVLAFFGFFEKYPEHKEMIIDVAYDTLFVYGNQPIEELAKDYDIDPSLVATVENAEGNESFCAGCYNPGYSIYISSDKI